MATFLYQYLKRDEAMRQQKKEVEKAKTRLIAGGMRPREAMKKIKKAFMGAVREKLKIS